MSVNFVEVFDVDGKWQSINLKQVARVCWGEVLPDSEKVDMVYLVEISEVALPHLSESSKTLAEALGIESLEELLGIESLEELLGDEEEESDGEEDDE